MDFLRDVGRYIKYRIARMAVPLEDEPRTFRAFR